MFKLSKGNKPSREDFPYLCLQDDLTVSYKRCLLAGVSVEQSKPQIILPESNLISRLTANSRLLLVTERLINSTCYFRPPQKYIFIICDPELVALKLFASQDVLKAAEKIGVLSGTVFTEESCGTNALSLAREHGKIVTIRGKQHYSTIFKNWWCSAGPVEGGEGKITGYLGISMPAERKHGLAVELLKALIIVLEKDIYLSHITNEMQVLLSSSLPQELKNELTTREQEICSLLLRRQKSKEIAASLNLSVSTVKTHRKKIYQKLGVNGLDGLFSKFIHP